MQGEGASASLPPSLDATVMVAQRWDDDGMLSLADHACHIIFLSLLTCAYSVKGCISFSGPQV